MSSATSRLLLLAASLLAVTTAPAGPLQTETALESGGWQARIDIDCYTPNAICGRFNFQSTGCQGELMFLREESQGFLFAERLTGGRCQPRCELWLSGNLDHYREYCRGTLSGQGNLTAHAPLSTANTVPATPPASPITHAQRQAALNTVASSPSQVIEAGDTTYRGQFMIDKTSGLVSGMGRVEWTNGDRYEGGFRDGEPDGQGTYHYHNGDRYSGAWVAGKRHGPGRYTFADQSYWEGEYANDEQTDKGRLFWQDAIDPPAPEATAPQAAPAPTVAVAPKSPTPPQPTRPDPTPQFKSRGECLTALGTDGATQCFRLFPEVPPPAPQPTTTPTTIPVAPPAATPPAGSTAGKACSPCAVKSRDGSFEGEVHGTIPVGSPWAHLQIGMAQSEVEQLLGSSHLVRRYVTGKAFIPFYFGTDSHRYEVVYPGHGSVAYTGGNMGGGSGVLMMINHDPAIR